MYEYKCTVAHPQLQAVPSSTTYICIMYTVLLCKKSSPPADQSGGKLFWGVGETSNEFSVSDPFSFDKHPDPCLY